MPRSRIVNAPDMESVAELVSFGIAESEIRRVLSEDVGLHPISSLFHMVDEARRRKLKVKGGFSTMTTTTTMNTTTATRQSISNSSFTQSLKSEKEPASSASMDSDDDQMDSRRRGVYIPRDAPATSCSGSSQDSQNVAIYNQHQHQLNHQQQQLLSKAGIAPPTSIPKPLPIVPHRVSVQQQPMHYQSNVDLNNNHHASTKYHHLHHHSQLNNQQSFPIQPPRASVTNSMSRMHGEGSAGHSESFTHNHQQYDPSQNQYYNNAYQQSLEINNQVSQNNYNTNNVATQSATNSHESYNNVSGGTSEKKSRSPKITNFFVDHIFNVRAQLDKDMEGVKTELERLLNCYGIGKSSLKKII